MAQGSSMWRRGSTPEVRAAQRRVAASFLSGAVVLAVVGVLVLEDRLTRALVVALAVVDAAVLGVPMLLRNRERRPENLVLPEDS